MAVKKGSIRGIRGHFAILSAKLTGLLEGLVSIFKEDANKLSRYLPSIEQVEERSIMYRRWAVVTDLITSEDLLQEYINNLETIQNFIRQNTFSGMGSLNMIENFKTLMLLIDVATRVKEYENALGVQDIKEQRKKIMRLKIYNSLATLINLIDKESANTIHTSLAYVYALTVDWQFRIRAELSKKYQISEVQDVVVDEDFNLAEDKVQVMAKESLSNMLINFGGAQYLEGTDITHSIATFVSRVKDLLNKVSKNFKGGNHYLFITLITNPQDYHTYTHFDKMYERILNSLGSSENKKEVVERVSRKLEAVLDAFTKQIREVSASIDANIDEVDVFAYPGSKWKQADILNSVFPKHSIYVEPYIGSGSVFVSKEQGADIAILNDIDPNIVDFWRDVALGEIQEEKVSKWWDIINQKLQKRKNDFKYYRQVVKEYANVAEEDPNLKFILSFIYPDVFYKVHMQTKPLPSKEKVLERLNKAKSALQKYDEIFFYNTDAVLLLEELRELIDREDTLIYLDPPYIIGSDTIYKTRAYQHNMALVNAIKKYKNATIVMHNYDPILEFLPDWFVVQEREIGGYAENIGSRSFQAKEILIINKPTTL